MRKICLFIFFILTITSVNSQNVRRFFTNQPLFMYGFRIGYNLPLNRTYSMEDKLLNSTSAEFGIYGRIGQYGYGEIGINYMFHKCTFEVTNGDSIQTALAELRYLQIPLKAVGYFPISKQVALLSHVGVIYQPLLQVTNNDILYSKTSLTQHQFVFTAGIGLKVHFVTIDVNYRQMLRDFYTKECKNRVNFINFSVGFQLK